MHCAKCGEVVGEGVRYCKNCGNSTAAVTGSFEDYPNVGFNILSFFFPIVGLIIFLVIKDNSPRKARAVGKSAIIGFIVGIIIGVLLSILIALAPTLLWGGYGWL